MIPILIAAIIIFIGYYMNRAYKNTKDIIINRIHIDQVNKERRLTILQLSDLHLENISISPKELYEHLKEEHIDIIALTGDFLDRKRTIPKLAPYLEVLNQLGPKYGIYAVLGNHDYVLKNENLDRLVDLLEAYNCTVLRNESIVIDVGGRPLNIIGIDDFSTNRSDIAASYKEIVEGASLVLTHDPNIVLEMKQYPFDYLLAGHFHGGQICYPKAYHLAKMGKLVKMQMIKGLHFQDGKPFYINEGLGQTGVNIRIGSRPEITLHQLPLKTHIKFEETAI
ncbi:putative MPP superfamily phosphohydrolase [Peribacillus deserti]|uniref:MPP superfamily phosphohydrolase n=2 Tax=Peribacillus deserti TaxID=673318 RepID=A0ABS2QDC8_9BACI|nr:metallophosphoesterase [Peribacillus deserti]MBM7691172.1 putative MPP superfamily phosphohydrolase [Peribacillus deserti]